MPKGSILVIDDEAEIREGLELLLKTEGYQVSMADTGQSGLSRLGERPFDLLLLDVSLPDRNGIELLKDIRRQNPDLPIVLITAYGSIEMARAAFKSGAMDYITKPWSNDELLAPPPQAAINAPSGARKPSTLTEFRRSSVSPPKVVRMITQAEPKAPSTAPNWISR